MGVCDYERLGAFFYTGWGLAMAVMSRLAERDRFTSVARQMSNWVDQVLGPNYHRFGVSEAWVPCVNVYEDQDHYCVIVDMAGVDPEQISLKIEASQLVISGVRESPGLPDAVGSIRVHLMEIDHGPFNRRIDLPDDADGDEIQANYRAGFLWIRLPKRA